MTKRAKTLKTKGFTIESRNKFGKVVFRVSILKYEKYKKFRVQSTPKGEGKRIDKEWREREKGTRSYDDPTHRDLVTNKG